MSDVSPAEMRRTLGRFCTGVTVITAGHEGGIHAMTANAFMSVSLDPPLVLISIDKRAKMRQFICDDCTFGVSVLESTQEPIAWHFAGRPMQDDEHVLETGTDGIAYVKGAIAHIGCVFHQGHDAGDHEIYLGRVQHLWSGDGAPLLFHAGKFEMMEKRFLTESWA